MRSVISPASGALLRRSFFRSPVPEKSFISKKSIQAERRILIPTPVLCPNLHFNPAHQRVRLSRSKSDDSTVGRYFCFPQARWQSNGS